MIEAMKQALEALMPYRSTITREYTKVDAAIDALRQAIAEAEKQEPKCVVIVEVFGKDWRLEYMSLPVGRHKLYTQQYLYTHPQPKREPLTREDLWKMWCNAKAKSEYLFWWEFARSIEAAHGIKE